MLIDSTSVTAFAAATGAECESNPYVSHNAVPTEKIKNIPSEMSRADRNRITRISCGRKESVVHVAAK